MCAYVLVPLDPETRLGRLLLGSSYGGANTHMQADGPIGPFGYVVGLITIETARSRLH
jgi:hypothetical protein